MGIPRPDKDRRGSDDWFNRRGIQTIIAFILVIITVVFFLDVFRDRRALEQSRHEVENKVRPETYGTGAGEPQGPVPGTHPPLGTIAGTTAHPESNITSEVVFKKASPSVVTVKIFGGEDKRLLVQGSGVVVGPGTVVTNRHVVESGSEIRVIDHGQAYPASVMYSDREYDLCALGVPGLPAPQVDMASVQTIRAGQRVYAIGSPRGLELSISDGLVSAIRPYGTFPVIQTNASISKGSSGGGLFDTDGRLVGITTSSAIDGQNINFALVADLIFTTSREDGGYQDPYADCSGAEGRRDQQQGAAECITGTKQAIAVSEAELKGMGEEINRHLLTLNEMKQSMDGFHSARNANAYNEMVPRYNQLVSLRSELANRYEQKRQAYVALVEQHNRMADQYKNQSRLQ